MEPRRPLPPAPAWAPAVPGPARETEAGARGEGAARVTPQAAASQFGSTRAQRGPGSSGSHTAGRGKLVGEHLGYRVGLPILAAPGDQGPAQLPHSRVPEAVGPSRVSPGPFGPGAASWEEGVSSRGRPQNPQWNPPSRSRTRAQRCPDRETESQETAGLSQNPTVRRTLVALGDLRRGSPLPGPPWLPQRASCELPSPPPGQGSDS
jgi:hypothetical protein